jgi:hypothetical protein
MEGSSERARSVASGGWMGKTWALALSGEVTVSV